jgi:hypothetical protein
MLDPRRGSGRYRRPVLAVIAAVVALGAGVALAFVVAGGSASTSQAPDAHLGRARYLQLAQQGLGSVSQWWDKQSDWYLESLGDDKARPLATIWDTNGLFEAVDELAIADPTPHNRAAVVSLANASQRFWNPDLEPQPGFSPYPGDRDSDQETFYDDNGWLGLAFLDADRATGSRRYLSDAERAFAYIAAGGWDTSGGGGMWWSNQHQWRSGESLAADADLAARMYDATRRATYLKHAQTYIGWANAHLLQPHGVYLRTASQPYGSLTWTTPTSESSSTAPAGSLVSPGAHVPPGTRLPATAHAKHPRCVSAHHCTLHPPSPHPGTRVMVAMPHDGEGAMMSAMVALCRATGHRSWCHEAERLGKAAMVWLAPFGDGPQYDSILLRGYVDLYRVDHQARWYRFAAQLAALVNQNARTSPGVYLRGWDGRAVPNVSPDMLRTDAGSIGVFADLATVKRPPPSRPRGGPSG